MVVRATDHSTHQRRACYFTGRVQGVGFRYTVQNIAIQHNVHGYVRNLSDGRVELVMEGEPPEMDRVIEAVSSKMNGFIKKLESDVTPANGEFDHFYIRH